MPLFSRFSRFWGTCLYNITFGFVLMKSSLGSRTECLELIFPSERSLIEYLFSFYTSILLKTWRVSLLCASKIKSFYLLYSQYSYRTNLLTTIQICIPFKVWIVLIFLTEPSLSICIPHFVPVLGIWPHSLRFQRRQP